MEHQELIQLEEQELPTVEVEVEVELEVQQVLEEQVVQA
jgi:hypothetical protein